MITLQNFILPDPEICTEPDLYVRLNTRAALDIDSGRIHLSTGGTADFGTYFNALSLRKWHRAAQLQDLGLEIEGDGPLELRLIHALPERSWDMPLCKVLTLEPGIPVTLDASPALQGPETGLMYLEVRALDAARIDRLRFVTSTTPESWPDLAISITTFRREAEVERTVERLEAFLARYPHADNIHIQVVDNGQSATIPATGRTRYIPNENLGGAGGFARGLLEAEEAGRSHVLFTDDDAAFPMESLHRAYMFLALARDDKTAIAGAMINNIDKWAMWENGAVFDRHCRPLSVGEDLRRLDRVFAMETFSANFNSPGLYAGWWFFAFPVARVERHPFPFFVRGDDISFSLANDFHITTLNGVVSFQDDFSEKESPMTLYLDTRNHIVQHLTIPHMEIGAWACAKIPLWFAVRNLIRFQYETMEACLLAWEDVMQGPQFFVENKDMTERRARLKTIMENEVFRPADTSGLSNWADIHQKIGRLRFFWLKLTLNGHLGPVRRRRPAAVAASPRDRPNLHMVWGLKEITYLAPGRQKSYTTRFDRARGLRLLWRAARNTFRFLRRHDRLLADYRRAYPETASRSFWNGVYGKTAPPAE